MAYESFRICMPGTSAISERSYFLWKDYAKQQDILVSYDDASLTLQLREPIKLPLLKQKENFIL